MEIQVFGGPCGCHGPYTFFKALKLTPPPSINSLQKVQSRNTRKCVENSRKQIRGCRRELVLALGDCVPVRPWEDSPIACLAEIRMIWKDKNEQGLLTSLRLYFLPENTPNGRNVHGEDEVIALNEQIVLRAEDLMQWVVDDLDWNWGLNAVFVPNDENKGTDQKIKVTHLQSTQLEFNDVDIEKSKNKDLVSKVAVISYPRYCRYRATLTRLESVQDEWIRNTLVETITGFVAYSPNMKIMFCRDTFEYPELETHENLCNHLAPKLKGRPRSKRRLRRSESPYKNESSEGDSDADESDASACSVEKAQPRLNIKPQLRNTHRLVRRPTKSESSEVSSPELKASGNYERKIRTSPVSDEKSFLSRLNSFMVKNPDFYPKSVWMELGQINLYKVFTRVQKLGGYDAITDLQTWSLMSNDPNMDDGAMMKKKYEKILLPFERHDIEFGHNSKYRLQNLERRLSPSLEIIPIKKEDYNGKDLTKEQMMKIQSLVKSRGGSEVEKRESDDRMSSVSVPLTTTITVQCNDQQIMNQIKITNQIQIQQIRVNSEDSPLRCNIKQDKSGSDVSEESGTNKSSSAQSKTSSLRNVRKSVVTTPPSGQREKENIPLFLGCKSTTITPIVSVGSSTINLNSTPKEQIIVTPEIVDLADNSDSESSSRGTKRSGGADSPSLAKRKKLDMLKAGGLEVTPISSNSAASALWQRDLFKAAGSMNPEDFLRTLQNLNSKLEITPSSTQNKYNTKQLAKVSPPKNRAVITSASLPKLQPLGMYAQTGRIYGDPKEILPPDYHKSSISNTIDLTAQTQQQYQQPHQRPKTSSTSSPSSNSTSNSKTNTIPVTQVMHDRRLPPSLIPAINLAQQKMKNNAGLQISLVQPPATSSTHVQNIHNSQNHNIKRKEVSIQPASSGSSSSRSDKNSTKHQSSREHLPMNNPTAGLPNLALANLFSNPLLFAQYMQQAASAASLPGMSNKQPSNSMPPHLLPPSFNPMLNPSQMSRTNQPNPFLSMMDPLYLSALYSNPRLLMQSAMSPELLQQFMKNLPPKDTPVSKS